MSSDRSTVSCRTAPPRLARLGRVLVMAMTGAMTGTVAVASCDGVPRAPDASAPAATQTAEISVRVDVSSQKAPTVSVLAFRAAASGVARREVLGIVDPLAAAGPERDCELRDVDLSASALIAQGGSIELQELSGIGIALGQADGQSSGLVRPFPRLYPDVATVVGGVVAEAGPLTLGALPERIGLLSPESELALDEVAVPAAPRITTVNGAPLAAGAKVDVSGGLTFSVTGGPGTVVEVRPFGATVAIACAVPSNLTEAGDPDSRAARESVMVVPRALLVHLMTGSAPIPTSLDVLRRAQVRISPATQSRRLSVEVRSATAVELRP